MDLTGKSQHEFWMGVLEWCEWIDFCEEAELSDKAFLAVPVK